MSRQMDLFWLWGYAVLTCAVVIISIVRAVAFFESTFGCAPCMACLCASSHRILLGHHTVLCWDRCKL